MNKMKKLLASIIFTCVLSLSVSAYEWGGVVSSDSSIATKDFSSLAFAQSDSSFLWIYLPFANNRVRFNAEGVYRFNILAEDKGFSYSNVLDIDLFKFSAAFGNNSYGLGRFAFIDITGNVFAQNMDGFQLKFRFPEGQLSVSGGYTGLLNELAVSMNDWSATAIPVSGNIYSLAYPYIFGSISFLAPAIFFRNNLQVEAIAVVDIGAQKKNRYFLNAAFGGSISSYGSYKICTSLESVDFTQLMNYSSVNFDFYPSDIVILSLGAEYASGNQGFLKPFSGVTARTAGSQTYSVNASGVLCVETEASVILDRVLLSANVSGIFDCMDSFDFNGIDIGFTAVYSAFSDLKLSAKAFAFLDMITSREKNNFGADFILTVGF